MADTPEGTSDSNGATPSTPRRRRTRGEPASAKGRTTTKRAAPRKAPEQETVAAKAAATVRKGRAKVVKAEDAAVKVVKPRAKRVAREVKSTAAAASKAATRKRLLVGAAAAAASVVAGIAATLGRNKIAKATGDVLESAKGQVDAANEKVQSLTQGTPPAEPAKDPISAD